MHCTITLNLFPYLVCFSFPPVPPPFLSFSLSLSLSPSLVISLSLSLLLSLYLQSNFSRIPAKTVLKNTKDIFPNHLFPNITKLSSLSGNIYFHVPFSFSLSTPPPPPPSLSLYLSLSLSLSIKVATFPENPFHFWYHYSALRKLLLSLSRLALFTYFKLLYTLLPIVLIFCLRWRCFFIFLAASVFISLISTHYKILFSFVFFVCKISFAPLRNAYVTW